MKMKLKHLLTTLAIFIIFLSVVAPVQAQEEPPAPARPDADIMVFLPLVIRYIPTYDVTGQIKDAQDLPLSGVNVSSDMGQTAVTDENGVYKMTTPFGSQKIAAVKDGYTFEPGTADLSINANMNNLNFTAISQEEASVAGCANLLLNPNFEGVGGWNISLANNPSAYTSQYWYSPVTSMLSGVPLWYANPFPYEYTTAEFWQPTVIPIPSNATVVNLRMKLLPRSSDYWGYHIAEQAEMDAAFDLDAPDATESQYGHIRDAANTTTLRQLFKWFPIDSYYWLYRSYNLMDFRGQTISVLFGAANDGWDGNTALYVDDVYLYYCVP
jgi:hypothetical protein